MLPSGSNEESRIPLTAADVNGLVTSLNLMALTMFYDDLPVSGLYEHRKTSPKLVPTAKLIAFGHQVHVVSSSFVFKSNLKIPRTSKFLNSIILIEPSAYPTIYLIFLKVSMNTTFPQPFCSNFFSSSIILPLKSLMSPFRVPVVHIKN